MEYCVYILQAVNDETTYTGSTSSIIHRIHQHNFSEFDKSSFTFKYRPWKLIHIEFFDDKNSALKQEKFIKSRGAKRYLKDIGLSSWYSAVAERIPPDGIPPLPERSCLKFCF